MKEEYKSVAVIASAFLFVLGVYLLGHAGANYINASSSNPLNTGNTGTLFSLQKTASIQLISGIATAFFGMVIFLVIVMRRGKDEDEYE